jgi:hypothetical protein
MASNAGLIWPDPDNLAIQNPAAINAHLESLIIKSHLQLLGELNFDDSAEYSDTDLTIFQLANFAFNKIAERSSGRHNFENYPAVCAIWGVAQAQRNEDSGQQLWALAPVASSDRSKLAEAFSDAVEALGLEDFWVDLIGEKVQRHVNLARMHAIVPAYAIYDFVNEIKKGLYAGFNAKLVHQFFLREGKAKPMSRLFEYRPDMAIDLIERSMKAVQFGIDAGLPNHILKPLLENQVRQRQKSKNEISLPIINFSEYGILYALGYDAWYLKGSKSQVIDPYEIKCEEIVATSEEYGDYTILDPSAGYLLFDRNFKLSQTMSKVPSDGYVLWDSRKISIDQDSFYKLPEYMSNGWLGWQFGQPWSGKSVHLRYLDGSIKELGVKPELRFREQIINNLYWIKDDIEYPVHAAIPRIIEGAPVTCTNNRNNTQTLFTKNGSELLERKPGVFNIDLYSGIGLSENISGFVIPDIEIKGDCSALVTGETRTLRLDSPILAPQEFIVEASQKFLASENAKIKISTKTTNNQLLDFYYKPQILSWMLVHEQFADESMTPIVRHVTDLKKVKLLNLFNADDLEPVIFAHQDDLAPVAIQGIKSGAMITFDLMAIRSTSQIKDKLVLQIRKSSSILQPITFKNYELIGSSDDGRRSLKDISKLKDFAIEAGVISQLEWNQYETQRIDAANIARKFRQNRWSN